MLAARSSPKRFGEYKVVRRLRSEGSIEVIHAREEGPMGFSRDVTLKCVRHDPDATALRATELAREARICARLVHPSIVRPIALSVHDDRLVLAVEGVESTTLEDVLAHLALRGERLPDAAAAYVIATVARALGHAHAMRDESDAPTPVLHRAVSPSSVVLARGGAVKLSGFGLAKVLDSTPDSAVGLVHTTGRIAAPEEVQGASPSTATDVWALGALSFRLLTAGQDSRSVLSLVAGRPPRLSSVRRDLPRELTAAIDAALTVDPEKRTIGCAEMARWIERTIDLEEGRKVLRELVDEIDTLDHEEDPDEEARGSRRRLRAMRRRASPMRLGVLKARLDGSHVVIREVHRNDERSPEPFAPANGVVDREDRSFERAIERSFERPIERSFERPIERELTPAPLPAPIARPAKLRPYPRAELDDLVPLGVPRRRRGVLGWLARRTVMLAIAVTAIAVGSATHLGRRAWAAAPLPSEATSNVASIATTETKSESEAVAPKSEPSEAPKPVEAEPAEPTPAPALVAPHKPPPEFGWLHVTAKSDAPGRVFVAGRGRGEPNKTILTPCGRYWVNVAKVDAKGNWRGWATQGKYVTIPCDGTVASLKLDP